MPTRTAVLLAVLLGLVAVSARAEDGTAVVVPVTEVSIVLDGRPVEAAWRDAAVLPTARFDADADAAPRVRALVSDDRLWVAASVDESPGPGMGLALMVSPEGAGSAAEALAVAFAPQAVQGPRWVVQGPRGAGRETYRVVGAASISDPERWSLEVALPLADLALSDAATPLRVALVVRSRTPSRVAWSPAEAAFRGPATWTRLESVGGWPRGAVEIDAAALAAEDRTDEDRLYAWSRFRTAYQATIGDLLTAAGHPLGALEEDGRKVVADSLHEMLVEPLEEVHRLRPDLAFAYVVHGGVLHQLGRDAEARRVYERGLVIMPGLREARFGIHLELAGPALAAGPVGGPTGYPAAFEAAKAARSANASGLAGEGARFGTALLHLAHGEFAEAQALLEPLAERYPFQKSVVAAAARVRLALSRWPSETRYRQLEAQRDDLPRVLLETSRGPVVLELFEDDAPNTVKNFVWLVSHGFYDGVPVARTVPFLLAEVGAADPGWAVATQRPPDRQRPGSRDARRRRPWRGTIVMLSATPDAAAARFALLTGTAPELEGDLIPFGRVVEGQEIVDALTADDRIEKAGVARSRPGTEYRPLTVRGEPAPAPR